MSLSVSSASAVDLRVEPVDEVLGRVERSLQVRLDGGSVVRKRRSVGARTDRDTWVRIERRLLGRIGGQGWNGTEQAAVLKGVAQPVWYAGLSWREAERPVMWRADETGLLPGEPVKPGGVLVADPHVPDAWWEGLNASLDALAAQHTARVATPDTVPVTQGHVTEVIRSTFPEASDTAVERWVPAHADVNWANVTGPQFCLFDWEDWGMAPRGLDSASLWAQSLGVPEVASRVRAERRADLESRDGMVMMLFACSKIAGPYAHPEDPRLEPARREAARLMDVLQTR
ncbi:hypothetical protein LHJ74_07735 [Streptomyces sp. N2-109]|uniref:Aminoglycoside phosphotransferase domain-containing protein n=1 Tax=Streptomyces gossypii TaxID=2883101 RepID=A0ABT2JPL8_9ACTN|nr:hypothetical protein [Streptomyces gossypii]MCT2589805.1 hypothetical protein [Streptomyces gossypii]